MHERNIYKIPHDFVVLAKKHAFLAPFLSLNAKGVPKINFKDQAALRALTKALLLEDFQLDVEIPENVLVPTVPLRLNYILWLEDLLSYNNGFGMEGSQICGIDVGTGATSIYALLAAKKNQWKMVGSEIDPESVMIARSNVKRNGLEPLIEIRHVKESVLEEVLKFASIRSQYTFTMCNPPFFSNEDETDSAKKSRKEDRPGPSGAKTGTKGELIVTGGEFEFVCQMINSSKIHPNAVKIFTTMIGIKRHVKDLIAKLKSEGITNFATTEFSQGKTTRWGLAWTFDPQVHLRSPGQVSHTFENIPGCLNFEKYIFSHLQNLNFKTLECLSQSVEDFEGPSPKWHFTAFEKTWTGQRRKRREIERLKKLQHGEEEPPKKLAKLAPAEETAMECDSSSITNSASSSGLVAEALLDGEIELIRSGSQASVFMRLINGSLGKDGLNQIMTYLKNCYNRDTNNPETELHQLLKCEKGN